MSAERGERPGIVDLRDLGSRYAWMNYYLAPFLECAGLVPEGEIVRRFAPPRVLLVIAPMDAAAYLQRSRAWLAEAEHVIVYRAEGSISREAIATDPELIELHEDEWREGTEGLDVVLFDDVTEALNEALARCEAIDPAGAAAPAIASRDPVRLPVSPWTAFADDGFWWFLERVERREDEVVLGPPTRTAKRAFQPGSSGLGTDPNHPIGWSGSRMMVYWQYRETFLSASDHDHPCGPSKKLYGYADNDPLQVDLAPDANMYAAHFEHDVLVTSAVPIPWQRAGAFDVVVRTPDPQRAVFFAQDPENDDASHMRPNDLTDDDARDVAPALVLMPGGYALDLEHRVYRIVKPLEGFPTAELVGGPRAGFAIFDASHQLVRRASGRLIGGWYRWATIEDAGWYWREDLVAGTRERIAPIDSVISEDAELEAVARDATFEGDFERAREIRRRGPTTEVAEVRVYSLPNTQNVLLAGKGWFRVV